jgi:hypothetical protein
MKSMHRFIVPALVLAALALSIVGVGFAREITESVFIKLTTEEREFFGEVQAIEGNTWTVDGLKVVVDNDTEIKDSILVGQMVKVHVRVAADGSMTAREIELAGTDDIGDNANDNVVDDLDDDDDNANDNEDDDLDDDDDNANDNEDDDLDDDDDNANDNEDDDLDDDDDNANDNEDDDLDDDDDNGNDNEDDSHDDSDDDDDDHDDDSDDDDSGEDDDSDDGDDDHDDD